MLTLFFAALACAAPPYVNYPYMAQFQQFFGTAFTNVTVWFAKNGNGNPVAKVASPYQSPYYPYDVTTYEFVSDNDTMEGTMSWATTPGYNLTNAMCHYSFNQSLADMFDLSSTGWLSQANVTVVGAQTLYTYDCSPNCVSTTFQNNYLYFSSGMYVLAVDSNGTPLSLSSASSTNVQLLFASKPTKLNSSNVTQVPAACLQTDRCPANKTQESIVLYRNHGNSTLFKQLDNVNLADLQGEVYWLCDYNAPSPLLSMFNLTVNPAWTQYMLCNRGVCDASNYGQRYGIGKQDNGGYDLCYDAPIENRTCNNYCGGAGTWYAFPELGRCKPNKPIGTNGCTWLDKYVTIKSITVSCLRQSSPNGFACSGVTIKDLMDMVDNAFNVCPDVQYLIADSVRVDPHEAVLPALGVPFRAKSS